MDIPSVIRLKRRYWIFLALVSYFFVIGLFQYPGFAVGAYILGFLFGIVFGLIGGSLLMYRLTEYLMENCGLRFQYTGWRATLINYGPKIARVAVYLLATGVGFYLILSILQISAIFGGSVIIPVYFGLAVLILNLAVALARDTPDYSNQFEEIIFQLNRIRKQLKRRSRRRIG